MIIKEIPLEDLLPLRAAILRNGKKPDDVIYPGDYDDDTFHIGVFDNEHLVTVGSFYKENFKDELGGGYRLRSMASVPEVSGKGYGRTLMNFAFDRLRSNGVSYLWCNARKSAVGFYEKAGLKIISDEFDIPEIGPHFVMIIRF